YMVVGITFLLRLRAVTTISHCALFALADTGTARGRTTSRYDEEDRCRSREEADQGKSRRGVWVCHDDFSTARVLDPVQPG
ncbi:hypothetical protein BGY98DRAFT_1016177, partial [Russula aff. rugulosa BPL654]